MSRRLWTALTCLLATPAAAAPAAAVHPGDPVPGHPGATWLDLVRQLVPDLAMDAADHQIEGHLKRPLRHLAGHAFQSPSPDPVVLGPMQARRVRVGGKARIALVADLGAVPDQVQGVTALLLYDDAPRPRLLDAADVAVDQDTAFADQGPLSLDPDDDALVTYSEHGEAGLTEGGYVIVSLAGDRLGLVDAVFVASEKTCGWSGIETPRFAAAPDPALPYSRIEVQVRAVFRRTGEDCGPEPIPRALTRTFRASYRWSPAHRRFEAASGDWKDLGALNAAAFGSTR
jgi:hypothetical protein